MHDAIGGKFYYTINSCEQGIVPADADAKTRPETSTTLPYQDASGGDELTIISFNAQSLRVTVPPVSRTS
jgi:hypothetical protein